MKYTNEQIRGAILRAADRIEREPRLYNFSATAVPGAGSCGCMWGHIGVEIGAEPGTLITHVANRIGFENEVVLYDGARKHDYHTSAEAAAKHLRQFADHNFPLSTPIVAEDRQLVRWDQCAWKPAGVRA